MKQWHPAAAAVNADGQRTYYLLHNGDIRDAKKEGTAPCLAVTHDEFCDMVRGDMVQIFEDHGQGPVVSYTEEEAKAFGKATRGHWSPEDTELYWRSENIFRDEAFGYADGYSLSLVMARKLTITKQYIVTGSLYARDIPSEVRAYLKKNSLLCRFVATDYAICNWEFSQFTGLISYLRDNPLTVCTQTMQHLDNVLYQQKMLGMKPVTEEECAELVRRVEFMQPPVPHVNTRKRANDVPDYDPYKRWRAFFQEHKETISTAAINGGTSAPSFAVVVTCAPTDPVTSYPTLRQLTLDTRARAWPAATSKLLCTAPEMGIMLVPYWEPNGTKLLANIVQSCSVGRIMSLHVFDFETEKLTDIVEFPIEGGCIIERDRDGRTSSDGVSKMSLQ